MEEKNKIEKIVQAVGDLNLGEIDELITNFKDRYNIKEEALVGLASAKAEEKSEAKSRNVSLKMLKVKEGSNKIKIYGIIKDAVKELKGEEINIIQAKKLTEKEDVFTDIPRDKAEKIKEKLESGGVEVEIKEI